MIYDVSVDSPCVFVWFEYCNEYMFILSSFSCRYTRVSVSSKEINHASSLVSIKLQLFI